jgi:phosphatidylglycerophosphatase C
VQLALFDLDGTITWRDTFAPYIAGFLRRHSARMLRLWRVPAPLLAYVLCGADRGRLKEALMVALLGGAERSQLARWTDEFVGRLIRRGMRNAALERIREHRARGDRLVLLSASPDLYVHAIGQRLGFDETVSTGVRWSAERLDGRLATVNRRGAEKVRCLDQLRSRHPGVRIVAYANSRSDFEHLRRADEGWLVSDRPGLRRRGSALGLRTASWR